MFSESREFVKDERRSGHPSISITKKIFVDYRNVVDHEFPPEDGTVNKEYYLQVTRCLHGVISKKKARFMGK